MFIVNGKYLSFCNFFGLFRVVCVYLVWNHFQCGLKVLFNIFCSSFGHRNLVLNGTFYFYILDVGRGFLDFGQESNPFRAVRISGKAVGQSLWPSFCHCCNDVVIMAAISVVRMSRTAIIGCYGCVSKPDVEVGKLAWFCENS